MASKSQPKRRPALNAYDKRKASGDGDKMPMRGPDPRTAGRVFSPEGLFKLKQDRKTGKRKVGA